MGWMVGKPLLILLPAAFCMQWVPDGSRVNPTVLGQFGSVLNPLVQLSTPAPSFSLCWQFWTSASLGILLCSALDMAELLFPCSKCDSSVCILPSACGSEREAHPPR